LICGVLSLKKLFVFNEIQLLYICFFCHLLMLSFILTLKRLDPLAVCPLTESSYFLVFVDCFAPLLQKYLLNNVYSFLLKYSPFFLSMCVCFISALPFYLNIFLVFNLSVNKSSSNHQTLNSFSLSIHF